MKLIKTFKNELTTVIFFIIIAIVFNLNFSILLVNGESMYPALNDKQIILIKKDKVIKKNQLIVFSSPESWTKNEKRFIKRVVAVEGDEISIQNDNLIINDEVIANIEDKKCQLNQFNLNVPKGYFFAVGDNYSNSNDSLTQLCLNNENYLVEIESAIISGEHFFD